jgi:hypothetical protein
MSAILFLALIPGQLSEQEKAWDARQQTERVLQKRVERRNQAVKAGGEGAADLVRRHREAAIDALLRLERDSHKAQIAEAERALLRGEKPRQLESSARMLVAYRLEQLPDPEGALQLIAREGEPAFLWMVNNHERLRDSWETFAKEPREYVHAFKELPAPVVADRTEKEVSVLRSSLWAVGPLVALAVAIALVALLRRRKRRPEPTMPESIRKRLSPSVN